MFKLHDNVHLLHGQTFGATLHANGCYFSVWAPEATSIRVHIYTLKEEKLGVVTLKERKRGAWFGFVEGVRENMCYAYEALGTYDPDNGLYFKEGHFLVDPYAKALNKAFNYSDDAYLNHNEKFIPKAIILGQSDFSWDGDISPFISRNTAILYEAHIKSLTMSNNKIPDHLKGTYLGFCHESVIEHLKMLGITVVQILPIAASMTEPYLSRLSLVNYWGYNPICFMAPDPRYAYIKANVVDEFKEMVKTFHKHGIAVILDVVFNHTAEAGADGPVLSFKGLDAKSYYAYDRYEGRNNYKSFLNYTGCGNTFNCDNTIALRLVIETLQYYKKEMHIDGFRFDLGVTVGREYNTLDSFQFSNKSAFFKICACDRLLSTSMMVGEPWDLGSHGYCLGAFPTGWSEQNDKFRDIVRRFWRGDKGLIAEFATRLMGSRDVFAKSYKSIHSSVNYVTYHDGFTLEDLVSYSHKHNELNKEDNHDGTNENFSSNQGVEGATTDKEILKKRAQLKRNLMATLILSQGIPHILSGDEFSKTQNGNNNTYCQDNDINYIKWNYSDSNIDFIKFISRLCHLRLNSKAMSELNLDDDNYHIMENNYLVRWRESTGHLVTDARWNDENFNSFLLYIGDRDNQGERWCIIINRDDKELMYKLPSIPANKYWKAVIDTTESDGVPSRFSNEAGLENVIGCNSIKILQVHERKQVSVSDDYITSNELYRHMNRTNHKYR